MFVRGGHVRLGNNLNVAGREGFYWSSVGLSGRYAYVLYFYPNGVLPSYEDYRNGGSPVRCVALGG